MSMVQQLWGAIPNPAPSAPGELSTKVSTVLGLIKWISLMCAVAVLLGAGALLFAGEHGHGAGMSPQLKSKLGSVLIALVVVGSASAIVEFLA